MSSFRLLPIGMLTAGVLLFSVACSDYVGKENSHPLYAKAMSSKNSGAYADSARDLEEFLLLCPKSAVTHYELAALYGDLLDDPFKAWYHYKRYSELVDPHSRDAEDIQQFIELSRRRIYDKLKLEYRTQDGDIEQMKKDLAALKLSRDEYVKAFQLAKEQNEKMRQQIAQINNQRRTGTATTTSSSASTSSSTSSSATSSNTSANTATSTAVSGDTYTVKSGDTLIGISRTVYGSSAHYKLILDANKDQVGEEGRRLRIGQKLTIPPLPGKAAPSAQ